MVVERERVDVRVLNEWECKVNECVRKRIASLRKKYINRRRGAYLKKQTAFKVSRGAL